MIYRTFQIGYSKMTINSSYTKWYSPKNIRGSPFIMALVKIIKFDHTWGGKMYE